MSEHEDPDRLAEELGSEAEDLQEHSDRLREEIGDVRQDWERKRVDDKVPGAPPPDEAQRGPGPPDEDDAPGAGGPGEDDTPEREQR